MRGFSACLNLELAARCLRMADTRHANYWGPTVPLVLLGIVGSFAAAICLADPQAHAVRLLFGLYVVYVALNGGRLGVGTPFDTSESLRPQPTPLVLATARFVAAAAPLLTEAVLTLPVWWLMGLRATWIVGVVLVSTLTGLFWATRMADRHRARVATHTSLALLPLIILGGVRVEAWLPRPETLSNVLGSSPHLYVAMALCVAATLMLAEIVSHTQVGESPAVAVATGPPGYPGARWVCGAHAAVPLHASATFLWDCLGQALSWGFRPWPRVMSARTLQESWYAIGLYTCLVLSLTFSIRLLMVAARNVDELAACSANERRISVALHSFALEHGGHYPDRLAELVPGYLRAIPTCPAAGRDTYSASYHCSRDPDGYSFDCDGDYHSRAGCPPNRPRCDNIMGVFTAASVPEDNGSTTGKSLP